MTRAQMAGVVQVWLRTLSGDQCSWRLPASATLFDIRRAVQTRFGVRPSMPAIRARDQRGSSLGPSVALRQGTLGVYDYRIGACVPDLWGGREAEEVRRLQRCALLQHHVPGTALARAPPPLPTGPPCGCAGRRMTRPTEQGTECVCLDSVRTISK